MAFKSVTSDFLVNNFTTDDQVDPNIAMNPETGGFQIVWASYGQDGDGWGVFGRNFEKNGDAVGDDIQINTVTEGDQTSPDVAFNEDGNGAWVWETTSIWFNTIDRDDTPISGGEAENIRTRSKTFGFESDDGFYYNEERVRYGEFDPEQEGQAGLDPRVISLGGDQFATGYLVEELFRGAAGYTVDEFTAYIPSLVPRNGQWSRNFAEDEIVPRAHTTYGDIAQLTEEEILVVTTMTSDFEGADGIIQFQLFERVFGNDMGLAFDLSDRTVLTGSGQNGPAAYPRVAILDDGGFAITWQEHDQTSGNEDKWNWDVFVQVFNADGSERSPVVAVHDANNKDQTTPEIAATQDGGFVITYTDADGKDVMLQRFDSTGVRLGETLTVNDKTKGTQGDSAVEVLSNGNVVVTWESNKGEGDGFGIFAEVLKLANVGENTAQYIVGTDANEKFSTGKKADHIEAGGGKDTVNGGKGDDYIDGGKGNDKLTGKKGNDTFVFALGKDEVTDFKAGKDSLLIDKTLGDGSELGKKDLKALAEVTEDGLLFDFGSNELLLTGIDSYNSIKDDISLF